ncbi:MAG: hypothetical protein KA750_12875, partial [Thermoflexales bacterium]|nr:hypothetical protein [Thermoflexales bacterium]
MAAFALMAIALAFPKPFDVFPVDAPIHLIGEGVTDLRCHHPESDYSNLIHLPGSHCKPPGICHHAQRTP